MSWRARIIKGLGGELPGTRVTTAGGGRHWRPFRRVVRAYKAAKQDRLTADWLSGGGDLNQELKSQLPILRLRAREVEQNSNIGQRFLSLCETHIVGPDGFTLQVQGKKPDGELDTENNNLIEQDYRKWSRRGVCEITGRLSRVAVERVSVRTCARDGESLIRMHDIQPTSRNPWGFVIEILDPARLDHLLNRDLKNGNRIRMGIELSPSGRPVAYWLKTGERGGWVSRRDTHERVDADDIIHWFEPERPEQIRAASWMASGLLTVHQIEAYQEAAITAARAGASKMGFYTQQETGIGAQALGDDEDEDGDPIEEFEPAHLGILPKGWGFTGFDPKYPHEAYGDFIKVGHRDLAVGWGTSYHALTGDLTDVNFSSTRAGTLEERERWRVRQDSFAACVLGRIYLRWLSASVLNNRFGNVPQETFISRFSEHKHQGRRWGWVDPLKDIQATIAAINAGLTSPQRVAAEMGVDVHEILDQIAAFQNLMKEKKVSLPVLVSTTNAQAEKPKTEEAGDADSNAQD